MINPATAVFEAGLLTMSQHGHEGFVDAPELFSGDVSDEFADPASVDGVYLLDEHPRGFAEQADLGAERGGPSAQGGGCD
jgi:hypothetical protein